MKYVRGSSWGVQALLAARTLAQFSNWQAHQINTSICAWEQPRAALVRNVVYLDGGDIYWTPGLASGANANVIAPENYQGLILTYNLSTSFSADSNITGILLRQELSKAPGGKGNANGQSPNFYDGAMLANDAQFFLYGGAPFRNDEQYKLPDQGAYIEYQAYQYGSNKPAFEPGFHDLALPSDVTRYVSYGAAANAPSENKAWYFSGLASPTHGSIVQNGNASVTASNVSQTLISVDMGTQNFQKWTNKTLPATVRGRANAELVWVPVGGQGILVVLGGVTYPDWASPTRVSANVTGSKLDSDFMNVIDIYDIENDVWYKQPASKAGSSGSIPSARARGCAVVAPAADFSSFNIFYYGGYDGIHPHDPFFDEVWVLSLPAFTWVKINEGTSSHGRAGHKCVSPYPDQMMVFGGSTPLGSEQIQCLEKGPVLNFNLTSGKWMDSYDPTNFGTYGVHESITAVIGGGASGGATTTKPIPSGFANDSLGTVFAKTYDQSKLTKWWPYTPESSSSQPIATTTPVPSSSGGLPKWAPAVLAVAAAVIFITCAAVLFFLWRRRHSLKKSDRSTIDAHRQSMISRIMDSLYSPEKRHMSMASVVSPIPMSPGTGEEPTPSHSSVVSYQNVSRHEMADTQLVELDAANTRSELQDTGLSLMEIDRRYSHWWNGTQTGSPSPSEASFSPSVYPPSSNPSVHRGFLSNGSPRIDSPPLGAIHSASSAVMRPPPLPELDESGISPHLESEADTPGGVAELPHDAGVVSPQDFVSPLSADDGDGAQSTKGHKPDNKSLSQASHMSSSTEDSRSTSSTRHIAFQIKDAESVEYLHKKEDGQGSGSGNGQGEGGTT